MNRNQIIDGVFKVVVVVLLSIILVKLQTLKLIDKIDYNVIAVGERIGQVYRIVDTGTVNTGIDWSTAIRTN